MLGSWVPSPCSTVEATMEAFPNIPLTNNFSLTLDIATLSHIVESKYCQVSCGSGEEFSFTLKPLALEPSSLKFKCVEDRNVWSPKNSALLVTLYLQGCYGNLIPIKILKMFMLLGKVKIRCVSFIPIRTHSFRTIEGTKIYKMTKNLNFGSFLHNLC